MHEERSDTSVPGSLMAHADEWSGTDAVVAIQKAHEDLRFAMRANGKRQ